MRISVTKSDSPHTLQSTDSTLAGHGFQMLDLALRPQHITNLKEVITIRDWDSVQPHYSVDLNLDRLSNKSYTSLLNFSEHFGLTGGGGAGLWVPILRPLRTTAGEFEVTCDGQNLETLQDAVVRQLLIHSLLVVARDFFRDRGMTRRNFATTGEATDSEFARNTERTVHVVDDSIAQAFTENDEARWCFAHAVRRLISDGLLPAAQPGNYSKPSDRDGRTPVEVAIDFVDILAVHHPAWVDLLSLATVESLVVARVPENARVVRLEVEAPSSKAVQRDVLGIWPRPSVAPDSSFRSWLPFGRPYIIDYQTSLPSTVYSYSLQVAAEDVDGRRQMHVTGVGLRGPHSERSPRQAVERSRALASDLLRAKPQAPAGSIKEAQILVRQFGSWERERRKQREKILGVVETKQVKHALLDRFRSAIERAGAQVAQLDAQTSNWRDDLVRVLTELADLAEILRLNEDCAVDIKSDRSFGRVTWRPFEKLADDQVGGRRPGCSNRRMMRVTATVVESALVRRLTSQAIVVLVAVVGLVGFLAAGTRFLNPHPGAVISCGVSCRSIFEDRGTLNTEIVFALLLLSLPALFARVLGVSAGMALDRLRRSSRLLLILAGAAALLLSIYLATGVGEPSDRLNNLHLVFSAVFLLLCAAILDAVMERVRSTVRHDARLNVPPWARRRDRWIILGGWKRLSMSFLSRYGPQRLYRMLRRTGFRRRSMQAETLQFGAGRGPNHLFSRFIYPSRPDVSFETGERELRRRAETGKRCSISGPDPIMAAANRALVRNLVSDASTVVHAGVVQAREDRTSEARMASCIVVHGNDEPGCLVAATREAARDINSTISLECLGVGLGDRSFIAHVGDYSTGRSKKFGVRSASGETDQARTWHVDVRRGDASVFSNCAFREYLVWFPNNEGGFSDASLRRLRFVATCVARQAAEHDVPVGFMLTPTAPPEQEVRKLEEYQVPQWRPVSGGLVGLHGGVALRFSLGFDRAPRPLQAGVIDSMLKIFESEPNRVGAYSLYASSRGADSKAHGWHLLHQVTKDCLIQSQSELPSRLCQISLVGPSRVGSLAAFLERLQSAGAVARNLSSVVLGDVGVINAVLYQAGNGTCKDLDAIAVDAGAHPHEDLLKIEASRDERGPAFWVTMAGFETLLAKVVGNCRDSVSDISRTPLRGYRVMVTELGSAQSHSVSVSCDAGPRCLWVAWSASWKADRYNSSSQYRSAMQRAAVPALAIDSFGKAVVAVGVRREADWSEWNINYSVVREGSDEDTIRGRAKIEVPHTVWSSTLGPPDGIKLHSARVARVGDLCSSIEDAWLRIFRASLDIAHEPTMSGGLDVMGPFVDPPGSVVDVPRRSIDDSRPIEDDSEVGGLKVNDGVGSWLSMNGTEYGPGGSALNLKGRWDVSVEVVWRESWIGQWAPLLWSGGWSQ